jgi:YNFM family putative membrane transporter
VAGALSDRLGRLPVLRASLGIELFGLLLALASPLPLVILGIALVAAGFFAAHAVASGWVGSLAAGDKGHATSLYLVTYYAGASLMGWAGGWFLAGWGWPGVILFCGAGLGLAFLMTLRLRAVSG